MLAWIIFDQGLFVSRLTEKVMGKFFFYKISVIDRTEESVLNFGALQLGLE